MKAVWAVFSARFRVLLQYRAAALAGVVTQVFFGLVIIAVFRAFYRSSGAEPPLPLNQLIGYAWLTQAFFSLLPWRADPAMVATVRTGDIAYELLRPRDLYAFWFARAVALKTAPVVLRAIPLFLVAGLVFGLPAPPSLSAALVWLASLLLAVLMASALTMLINLSLLWTLSADGVQFLLPTVVALLSGLILPLPLFPGWLQPILGFLPFRGLLDTPHRIYLGLMADPISLVSALAHQGVWVALLVLFGRWLMTRGLARVEVQGG